MSNKPGYVKLREDIAAVRKLFANPTFRGVFNMETWGEHVAPDHPPAEQNYCGTQACLAGWLSQVSTNGFTGVWNGKSLTTADEWDDFDDVAVRVYGLEPDDAYDLFMNWEEANPPSLEDKLAEAAALADALEALDANKTEIPKAEPTP